MTFLSSRDDSSQVYKLPMTGGEAIKVTESGEGVDTFEWAPVGNRLAYISNEPAAKLTETIDGEDVEVDTLVETVSANSQQVWILDGNSGQLTQLTSGRWRISAIVWAPDGASLFVAASSDVDSEIEHDRLYSLDIESKEMRELLEPGREFDQIKVSPDGKLLSFTAARVIGPETFDLFMMPANGGQVSNLTRDSLDRKVYSYAWTGNDTITALVQDGFNSPMYEITIEGTARRLPDLPVGPAGTLIASDSLVAFFGSSFVTAKELWVSENDGQFKAVTSLNEQVTAAADLPEPRLISYQTFDGLEIEAALYLPDQKKPKDNYPLVVMVHGGPSSRWANQFNPSWSELLVNRGFAVLAPNIRGSTGYGYDFVMGNIKDLGGGDFKDVLAGVDHLVAEGIADSSRVGIAGWSYGGYMAAWAVTQTDRFKVAVSGAPVTNWLTEYGTEASFINRYDRSLLGAPYDDMGLYAKVSPVSGVRNASTPMLLVCAENDIIDPIAQCWEYYRGLKQNHVETEYVIYKGVGHSRGSWSNWQQIDLMNRTIAWIEDRL
jgi:dipeptidyl aminopeptidase/acylaminoacyl peptidase